MDFPGDPLGILPGFPFAIPTGISLDIDKVISFVKFLLVFLQDFSRNCCRNFSVGISPITHPRITPWIYPETIFPGMFREISSGIPVEIPPEILPGINLEIFPGILEKNLYGFSVLSPESPLKIYPGLLSRFPGDSWILQV